MMRFCLEWREMGFFGLLFASCSAFARLLYCASTWIPRDLGRRVGGRRNKKIKRRQHIIGMGGREAGVHSLLG
jgi:hypothetical protein